MKRIFAALLFIAIIVALNTSNGFSSCVEAVASANDESLVTYMLCGYDDAAENTDSIVLASYSFENNTMAFIQVPRDTYYAGVPYSKINSIYPAAIAAGKPRKEALGELRCAVSRALGVHIDGCIGYTMQTFVALIDAIGGVELVMPSPFSIKDSGGEVILSLSAGKNSLSGSGALAFVRARNGYTTGDLGRIDAQKIFLSAFMHKIKNDVGITDIIKACISTSDGWTLDAKIGDLFKIIAKNRGRISEIATKYANLPGSQMQTSDGIWYYCAASAPSDALFAMLSIPRCGSFDPDGVLLNSSDDKFIEIYRSTDMRFRVYDDSSLAEIEIGAR